MKKLVMGAVLLVAISIASFFFTLTYETVHLGSDVHSVAQKSAAEIDKLDVTRKSIDDLTVMTTTLIIDADNTESKESGMLDSWNRQLTGTLTNVNKTVADLDTDQNQISTHTVQMIDASTKTVADVQPVLGQLRTTLGSLDATVSTLNKVAADPAIPQTVHNVQDLTKQSVDLVKQSTDTMQHLSGTTADVQQAVHSYFHPTWPQRLYSVIKDDALSAAKFFF